MQSLLKRAASAVLLGLFFAGAAWAQTGTITGQVTDNETGETLPQANVFIEEIGLGAATDMDGRFTIADVPARAEPYTVRASYVGFDDVELPVIVGAGETVTVTFEMGGIVLEGLVVTAQGLIRQERELGYAVTEIDGDETLVGDQTNALNALAGRVPGLDISSSSGNVGSSTRVVLRGVTSLSGDNQPLFVVDGIPISNANISNGTRISGSIDTGNRASDINPNDIESVTVLKGGAAAALYGSRARNGVVLITTRRGINRPRGNIQVSSSINAAEVLRLPDFQNQFAAGDEGTYSATALNGWGPEITGQTVTGYPLDLTADYVLTPQPDNVASFYQSGVTATNSISFSTANDNTDFRLGITNIQQGGIVPEADLDRTSISINAGTRFATDFSARLTGNYVNTGSLGRVAAGGNDPNVLASIINGLPRTLSTADLENYFDETGAQRTLGNFTNNPYFIVNENPFTSGVERVFGSGTIGYDPMDWLSFSLRVGTDFYTETRRRINSVGTLGAETGAFRDDVIQQNEVNADLIGTAERQLTEDFSLRVVAGANINERQFEQITNTAQNLSVAGLYNFGNADQNTPSNGSSLRRLVGFYGDVTLGYQDVVFLNLTGRNDFSSTLPVNNNSYFYPSAQLSVIFSDLLNLTESGIIDYGKLRLNAARVGSDEAPYQLDFRYFPVQNVFGQYGTGFSFPYLGLTGFNATGTVPPADLRPQQQTTYEVGTELSFFNSRLTMDLTLYDQRTTDQILSLPIPESTGFNFRRTNVGEVSNRGFEATLQARTLDFGDFSHDLRVNFATNSNEVVSLAEGVREITLQSAFNSLQVRAEPGQPLGLYGTGILRDSVSGLPIVNPNTGLLQSGENIRLGGLDPDFRIGIGNTFRYAGVSLSFLIDWKEGGSIYSETVQSLRRQGLAEETAANRDQPFIIEGVVQTGTDANGDPIYSANTIEVTAQEYWQSLADPRIIEGGIFDASYVKLREVTLGYTFPSSLLSGLPFSRLSVAVEGRNLALLHTEIPHIDPETNLFGSGTVAGEGVEFNNLPSTRSYGFSLNFQF